MPLATLVNTVKTESVVPYLICEYSVEGIGADTTSTELIELELPSISLSKWSHRNIPNITTNGRSFIINLKGFAISCNSTRFDVRILNINNITRINTINEVVTYTGINLLKIDQSFDRFIIRNRDNILDNKIYLYINNHDIVPTGIIRIELIYVSVQDREF